MVALQPSFFETLCIADCYIIKCSAKYDMIWIMHTHKKKTNFRAYIAVFFLMRHKICIKFFHQNVPYNCARIFYQYVVSYVYNDFFVIKISYNTFVKTFYQNVLYYFYKTYIINLCCNTFIKMFCQNVPYHFCDIMYLDCGLYEKPIYQNLNHIFNRLLMFHNQVKI